MDNKRSETRSRRLKGGQIIFNAMQSVIDCQMRDMSENGARLKFVSLLGVPDEFQITVPGLFENRWARKAWNRYDEIGVEFY
jgi:hypothetical protein